MKKLDKSSLDLLNKMISDKDSIRWIASYAQGLGVDVDNPASCILVNVENGTLSYTYRGKTTYKSGLPL